MMPKASDKARASSSPLGVGVVCRPFLSNSAWPNHPSSWRIWWLTADWVTCSSAAALEKLCERAAASRHFKALSGGKRDIGLPMSFAHILCE